MGCVTRLFRYLNLHNLYKYQQKYKSVSKSMDYGALGVKNSDFSHMGVLLDAGKGEVGYIGSWLL